jgi:DNA-binding MarR family transcriptional regulator
MPGRRLFTGHTMRIRQFNDTRETPLDRTRYGMGEGELGRHGSRATTELFWNIASISSCHDKVAAIWADRIGMSAPQWRIIITIKEMDCGFGVSVKDVSRQLRVDASFVTTQTKMLAKAGFIERMHSQIDARVVLMSLTERSSEGLEKIDASRRMLDDLVLEMTSAELRDITERLSALRRRYERSLCQVASVI